MKPNFSVANEQTIAAPPTVDFGACAIRVEPCAVCAMRAARHGLLALARQRGAKPTTSDLNLPLVHGPGGAAPSGLAATDVRSNPTAAGPQDSPRGSSDLTGTLTAEQQATLEDKLAAFEARKGSQIAVLVVADDRARGHRSTTPIRVAHNWKLGRPKIDDGALLIVAKNDRELRIEVGRALEGR